MSEPPEKPPATPPPYYVMMSAPETSEPLISIADLYRALARHKWLLLAITLISTAAATTYALLATPIFRAEVLAAPAQKQDQSDRLSAVVSQFGGLANLAGLSMPSNADIETAIATLKSRRLISTFIIEQNLKPILFHEDWDSEHEVWIPDNFLIAQIKNILLLDNKLDPTEQLAPGEPSMWEAFERFSEDVLSVIQDRKTGLVTIRIDWKDPILAAQWANELVDRVNAQLSQKVIEESERGIQYLNEQVRQTSLADLRTALYRIIEEYTKNMTLAKVNDEFALKVIDPAVTPREVATPKRPLIVTLGILLGLMLGSLGAIVRHFQQETHQSSQQTNIKSN